MSLSSVFSVVRRRLRQFDRHLINADTQRSATSIVVALSVLLVPVFSAWQVAKSSAAAAEPV
ncbi:MAG: hypothetical protein ACO3II_02100, partial [Ilumatobacteraceae bacterium]